MRSIGIRASCELVAACLLTLLQISSVQGTAVSIANDIWTAHNDEAWGM